MRLGGWKIFSIRFDVAVGSHPCHPAVYPRDPVSEAFELGPADKPRDDRSGV
jgi:hypothetical protein